MMTTMKICKKAIIMKIKTIMVMAVKLVYYNLLNNSNISYYNHYNNQH